MQTIEKPFHLVILGSATLISWSHFLPYGYEVMRGIIALAGYVAILLMLIDSRRFKLPPTSLLLWITLLISSLAWAADPGLTGLRIVQVSPFLLFSFFVVHLLRFQYATLAISRFLLFAGCSAGMHAVYLIATDGTLRSQELGSVSNLIGSACELGMPFALVLIVAKRGARSLLGWPLFGLMVFGIVASGSRGALLASIAGILAFFAMYMFGRQTQKAGRRLLFVLSVPLAMVLFALVSISFLPSDYIFRIEYRFRSLSLDDTVREAYFARHDNRLAGIHDSYEAIRERPLVGWGFGGFQLVSSEDIFLPHNWLFSSWITSGILGALAITTLAVVSICNAFRRARDALNDRALYSAFFASVVMVWGHGLVRPIEFNLSFYVLVVWAGSAAILSRTRSPRALATHYS